MNNHFLIFLTLIVLGSCNRLVTMQAIEVDDFDTYFGKSMYTAYYKGNYIVIKKPVRVDSFVTQFKIESIDNEVSSNKKSISTRWIDEYYVFRNDGKYASKYSSDYIIQKQNLSVDSLLEYIRGTNKWDSFARVPPDTSRIHKTGTLEETYSIPGKGNSPDVILKMYYSNRLKHLKESLNQSADSIKHMKLFKTKTIMLPFYDPRIKGTWPMSENITEMKEIKVAEPNVIAELINRHKKEIVLE